MLSKLPRVCVGSSPSYPEKDVFAADVYNLWLLFKNDLKIKAREESL